MPMTNERYNELASFAYACANSTQSEMHLAIEASKLKPTKSEVEELEKRLMDNKKTASSLLDTHQMQKGRLEGELRDALLIDDEDKAGKAVSLIRGKLEMAEAKIKKHNESASSEFSVSPLRNAVTKKAAQSAISSKEIELDNQLSELLKTVNELESLIRLADTTFRGASKVRGYVANALTQNGAEAGRKSSFDLTPYY